ncbi:replication initiation protein [Salmonirosea aquatica]|uniref:RepB family plasmid replication initiator protein n=1 Tax=Salmonirosea aquatica TaxID=2654236 RepID=A0A7C9F9D6_9BACT|nr:RepB family plasmid replication initiator protein [Cytophagaceae bacterium SJW1-29]
MEKHITKKATQHNHLVNAKFDMSTYEMRLFISLLGRLSKADTEFSECQIHLTDFMDKASGGKTYQIIKDSCVSLSKKVIQIESLVEGNSGGMRKKFIVLPLMAMVAYQEGEATITAQFNNKLKPYLLNLAGNFTQAEIKQLFRLKSFYSYRLYWLLKQHQAFGQRYIEIDELREMLNLREKYERFQDFKLKVINAAKKELKSSDMAFTYDLVKKGRKVEGIRFYFATSASLKPSPDIDSGQQQLFPETESESAAQIVAVEVPGKVPPKEILAKLKLSSLQINRILQRVPADQIYKTAYDINITLLDNQNLNPAAFSYSEFERRYFPKE